MSRNEITFPLTYAARMYIVVIGSPTAFPSRISGKPSQSEYNVQRKLVLYSSRILFNYNSEAVRFFSIRHAAPNSWYFHALFDQADSMPPSNSNNSKMRPVRACSGKLTTRNSNRLSLHCCRSNV